MPRVLLDGGLKLVSGGTDNHLMLVDFSGTEMTGRRAQELLDRVGITANKNTVPYDERPPTVTSGLRLGTPAMTTRGFGAEEMREVGRIIVEALTGDPTRSRSRSAAPRSPELTGRLPAVSIAWTSDAPSAGKSVQSERRAPAGRDYFMEIARVVATRSSCLRRQVGAVLVKNRQILATATTASPEVCVTARSEGACATNWGYPPASGTSSAAGSTPSRTPSSRRRTTVSRIQGAELYCTHQPCAVCAKMLVNAGIVAVYFCGRLPRCAGHGGLRGSGTLAWCATEIGLHS